MVLAWTSFQYPTSSVGASSLSTDYFDALGCLVYDKCIFTFYFSSALLYEIIPLVSQPGGGLSGVELLVLAMHGFQDPKTIS